MRTRNDNRAFTLIELILVMAILATLFALSAPLLSRSFRQRGLEEDAAQWFALSEYARDEAVSQGVPMTVWVNPQTGGYGVRARDGYEGDLSREKTYALQAEHRFDLPDAPADRSGAVTAAGFEPDGTLAEESLWEITVADGSDNRMTVTRKEDGDGYEIVKP